MAFQVGVSQVGSDVGLNSLGALTIVSPVASATAAVPVVVVVVSPVSSAASTTATGIVPAVFVLVAVPVAEKTASAPDLSADVIVGPEISMATANQSAPTVSAGVSKTIFPSSSAIVTASVVAPTIQRSKAITTPIAASTGAVVAPLPGLSVLPSASVVTGSTSTHTINITGVVGVVAPAANATASSSSTIGTGVTVLPAASGVVAAGLAFAALVAFPPAPTYTGSQVFPDVLVDDPFSRPVHGHATLVTAVSGNVIVSQDGASVTLPSVLDDAVTLVATEHGGVAVTSTASGGVTLVESGDDQIEVL